MLLSQETIEPAVVERLQRRIGTVSAARQSLGLAPERAWTGQLAAMFARRPSQVAGSVPAEDAALLLDVIEAVRPDQVIEVGTASGVSTAALALGVGLFGNAPRGVATVHSFDLVDRYYADRSLPVGFALRPMAMELAECVVIHTGATASTAAEMFAGRPVRFAFLDANHCHPSPAEDLLALLPALSADAWVGLHDVALPQLYEYVVKLRGSASFGPEDGVERLFNAWPFERVLGEPAGGRPPNCGAIRLPGDHRAVAAFLNSLINTGQPSDRSAAAV